MGIREGPPRLGAALVQGGEGASRSGGGNAPGLGLLIGLMSEK